MQVIDGLSAVVARVDNEPKAAVKFEFFGEFGHHVNENVRGKIFVFGLELRDVGDVFLRDNQHVLRSLRTKVASPAAILQKIQSVM